MLLINRQDDVSRLKGQNVLLWISRKFRRKLHRGTEIGQQRSASVQNKEVPVFSKRCPQYINGN